jgi:hypothetical protein
MLSGVFGRGVASVAIAAVLSSIDVGEQAASGRLSGSRGTWFIYCWPQWSFEKVEWSRWRVRYLSQ